MGLCMVNCDISWSVPDQISDSRPGAYRGTYFNTAALIGITGHCFKHHKSIAENKGPV